MITSKFMGQPIYFKNSKWFFTDDNGECIPASESEKECKHCGKKQSHFRADPCIGKLPGVKNACCGHGNRELSYIQFENGTVIRGFELSDY